MKINNYYPGWIADNICNLCELDDKEEHCDGCVVSKIIESDEVEKKRYINE